MNKNKFQIPLLNGPRSTVLHCIISPAIQAGPLLHLQMELSNVEIGCQLPCPCGGQLARQRRGGPKDKNVRVDNEIVHAKGVGWHPKQESDMICLKSVDCGLSRRKKHTWSLDNPWCRKRTQKIIKHPKTPKSPSQISAYKVSLCQDQGTFHRETSWIILQSLFKNTASVYHLMGMAIDHQ